ncbi:unnamed protein product, partial [Heterotrigona itama]
FLLLLFLFASSRRNILIEATYRRNCYSRFLFTRHYHYYSAISAISTMDDINRCDKYSASAILGNT